MVTLKNCLTKKEESLFPFGRLVTQTHHPSPDFCTPARSSTSCAALSGTLSMLLCTDMALCSWWDYSGGVQKPQYQDSDQFILILDDISKARKNQEIDLVIVNLDYVMINMREDMLRCEFPQVNLRHIFTKDIPALQKQWMLQLCYD